MRSADMLQGTPKRLYDIGWIGDRHLRGMSFFAPIYTQENVRAPAFPLSHHLSLEHDHMPVGRHV